MYAIALASEPQHGLAPHAGYKLAIAARVALAAKQLFQDATGRIRAGGDRPGGPGANLFPALASGIIKSNKPAQVISLRGGADGRVIQLSPPS